MEVIKVVVTVSGIISALCWLRAGTVTVSHGEMRRIRQKIAHKTGEKTNYGSISLFRNGKEYDLIETLHKQSFWNSCGAIMSAITIILTIY